MNCLALRRQLPECPTGALSATPDRAALILPSEVDAADVRYSADISIAARARQRMLAVDPLDDRRELLALDDREVGFHLENSEPALGRFQVQVRVEQACQQRHVERIEETLQQVIGGH